MASVVGEEQNIYSIETLRVLGLLKKLIEFLKKRDMNSLIDR